MIQVEFAGYTQLSPRIEQSKQRDRGELRYLLVKRGCKPFRVRRQRGFDPPLRVKPRFHREKERERIERARLPRASCAVDNKRDARHNSQREWTSSPCCKVNEHHRAWICTLWQQVTCTYKFDRHETSLRPHSCAFEKSAQLLRFAQSISNVWCGHATKFDWMRFDKKYGNWGSSLIIMWLTFESIDSNRLSNVKATPINFSRLSKCR